MGCRCSVPVWKKSDIRCVYKLGAVLGCGSFGQVRACVKRGSGEEYACKIMAKDPPKLEMFRNEINMLQKLVHRNIVRCLEVYEDSQFLYAILERCKGGELFTRIVNQKRFTEADASILCSQMLASVAFIHNKSIVHRDVKAENFLLVEDCSRAADSRLVLIDFGMSIQVTGEKRCRQVCGSPHYVAPELIRRSYFREVDNWAIGVVIYLMLYGRYPFEGADQKSIAQKILKCEPDYHRGSSSPSSMAIDFMKRLLTKDPYKRITAEEALKHPWIKQDSLSQLHLFPISDDVVERAKQRAVVEREYFRNSNYENEQKAIELKLSVMDKLHDERAIKNTALVQYNTAARNETTPTLCGHKQNLPHQQQGKPPVLSTCSCQASNNNTAGVQLPVIKFFRKRQKLDPSDDHTHHPQFMNDEAGGVLVHQGIGASTSVNNQPPQEDGESSCKSSLNC